MIIRWSSLLYRQTHGFLAGGKRVLSEWLGVPGASTSTPRDLTFVSWVNPTQTITSYPNLSTFISWSTTSVTFTSLQS